jgi:hypothetical protein
MLKLNVEPPNWVSVTRLAATGRRHSHDASWLAQQQNIKEKKEKTEKQTEKTEERNQVVWMHTGTCMIRKFCADVRTRAYRCSASSSTSSLLQDKSITRRNRASNPNPKTRRDPMLLLFCLLLKSLSLKLLDLSVSDWDFQRNFQFYKENLFADTHSLIFFLQQQQCIA